MHTLILIGVVLLIVGVVLWGLGKATFIDPQLKAFVYYGTIVVAAIWAIWLLYTTFGR